MYNFKTIDYRLSRQEYIFSVVDILDENQFDFVYVPYAEFPALLMLDYILATNPREFNIDLFQYFSGLRSSEKFGEKDILIISKDLGNRYGTINRLGVYKKDTYLTQIQEQSLLGRKQTAVEGKIVSLNAGQIEQRMGIILDNIESISEVREVELKSIIFSEKDELPVYIFNMQIPASRLDENWVELINSKNLHEKGAYETIFSEEVLANTLNQFEGLVLDTTTFEKDYVDTSIASTGGGFRDNLFLGSMSDITSGGRYTYVEGTIDDYILSEIAHESSVVNIYSGTRYHEWGGNIDSTILSHYTKREIELIYNISSSLELNGDVLTLDQIQINRDSESKVIIENGIDGTTESSRLGDILVTEDFSRINEKEGVLEFLVSFYKPKLKLIKSWLDEFEKDNRKDLVINFPIEDMVRDKRKDLEKFFINIVDRDKIRDLEKFFVDIVDRSKQKDLEKFFIDIAERYKLKNLDIDDDLEEGFIKRVHRLDKDDSDIQGTVPNVKHLDTSPALIDSSRYKLKSILKSDLEKYDYEKEAFIDYVKYFEKCKDAIVSEQISGKGLLYDYSDIIEDGMDVEEWDTGYAIPEDYDPQDPFNPYYPWAEERNNYSIVQEEEWEETQGNWEFDNGNAVIGAREGGGMLITKIPYGDFKFKFKTQVGYMPECRTGFIFRYDDVANYYKVTISSGNNPIELIQVINGRARKVASPIAPFYLDGGSWHELDISLINDRLTIYLDGRLQYDLILES